MRPLAIRLTLALPVLIVLGFADSAQAQVRAWGLGVGIGYGPYWGGPYVGRPGFGPSWGWGPAWGFIPTHYQGFWGNGLSMYGPPVPTGKPIPGVFGGADSTFFTPPPLYPYPGFAFMSFDSVRRPAVLPPGMVVPAPGEPGFELLPAPGGKILAPELEKPAAFEVEIRLPREDARLFIDGAEADGNGLIRGFATKPHPTAELQTYQVRAEWKVDGLTTTLTKKVIGRPGEKVVVEFK